MLQAVGFLNRDGILTANAACMVPPDFVVTCPRRLEASFSTVRAGSNSVSKQIGGTPGSMIKMSGRSAFFLNASVFSLATRSYTRQSVFISRNAAAIEALTVISELAIQVPAGA